MHNKLMDTLAERARWARDRLGYTLDEVAEKSGASHASIAHMESGRGKTSRYIFEIAAALEVDAQWLANGTGKHDAHLARHRQQQSSEAVPSRAILFLDDKETEIIDAWRMADDDAKSIFNVAIGLAHKRPASIKRQA